MHKLFIHAWITVAWLVSMVTGMAADDLSTAYRTSTRTRTQVSLNGLWQFQPAEGGENRVPTAGWLSLRVPGTWGIYEAHGGMFRVTGPDGAVVTSWKGDDIQKAPAGWFRRTFRGESSWQRHRLLLEFEGVYPLAHVWVNGQEAGRILPFAEPILDVTALLRTEGENELAVYVDGTGYQKGDGRIGYGIVGNVWLHVVPYVGSIVNVSCEYRSKDRQCVFSVQAQGVRSPRMFPVVEVEVASDRKGSVKGQGALLMPRQVARVALDGGGLEPWSFENPRLYDVTVRLNIGGLLLDETVVRTGLREFRTAGSDFLLNGTPVHLRFESGWDDTNFRNVFDEAYIRAYFGVLKDLGYNGVSLHTWWTDYPFTAPAVRIADEMGLLMVMRLPRLLCDAEGIVENTDAYTQSLAQIRQQVNRYSLNPSLVMWRQTDPGVIPGDWLDPQRLGMFAADRLERSQFRRMAALKLRDAIEEMDPSRVVFLGYGNMGRFYSCKPYLTFPVPLQERAEWLAPWSEKHRVPLVAEEFTAALPQALINGHDWDKAARGEIAPEEQEVLTLEQAARYLGDDAYTLTRDMYPNFAARGDKCLYARFDGQDEWNDITLSLQNEPYMKLCALYARDTLRAWRTYGVNGLWLFGCADVTSCQNIICHLGERRLCREYPDLSLPGAKLDVVRMPAFDARTPVYEVLRQEYGPVLAYIGGEKNPPNKDHAFFAGETMHKQVVFLNDHLAPVSADGWCRLLDSGGQNIDRWRVRLRANPGEVVNLPVAFAVPRVNSREQFFLKLELQTSLDEKLVDWLPFEVFPRCRLGEVASRCIHYDEVGLTERMLDQMGLLSVRLQEGVDLRDYGVLIIGRDSFSKRLRRLLLECHFDEATRTRGLRTLILEQTDRRELGPLLTERNTRIVFPRSPSHPALRGLSAVDFRYWRGSSYMVEPWHENRLPGRFYKGANTNTVAAFVLEKPIAGACRTILDCGFDQSQAAAIELQSGSGRVLWSQVDATERYGTDPVSSQYLQNLIGYLDLAEPRTYRATTYLGDPAWLALLEELQVSVGEFTSDPKRADVVIVGPGVGENRVLELADAGAFAVCLDPEASVAVTRRIFGEDTVAKVRVFRFDLNASAAAFTDGLAAGDLFLKNDHDLTLCTKDGHHDGVLSFVHGTGYILLSLVEPGMIHDARAKAKIRRLQTTLLLNSGVPFSGISCSAVAADGPPVRCLDGGEGNDAFAGLALEDASKWPDGTSVTQDHSTGDGDSSSVRIDFTGSNSDFHHAWVDFKVEEETYYELEYSLKMHRDGRLNRVGVELQGLGKDGNVIQRIQAPGSYPWLDGERDWTRFSEHVVVDAGVCTFRVVFRRVGGGGDVRGTVWFDRISLRPRYTFPPVRLQAIPPPVSDYDPDEWRQW